MGCACALIALTFFFNLPATTEIYTLSLHDALPIYALQGAQALDDLIERKKLVGLQTSVYYLPYFPEQMRFHFNAHNLLVYGKHDGRYQVSDPVFEEPVTVTPRDLNKARFVRGPLAPKGLMYTIES